jgi:phosphoribosylaminoimidazole-succinocarboxamide synthase
VQNRYLQKSVADLETVLIDVNCTNSKLLDENNSLKERLGKESEKCNDMTRHLQTVREAETVLPQEIVALKKQLVSLYKFVSECLNYSSPYLSRSHLR